MINQPVKRLLRRIFLSTLDSHNTFEHEITFEAKDEAELETLKDSLKNAIKKDLTKFGEC